MRILQVGLLLFSVLWMVSCSSSSQEDQVAGEWMLSSFTDDAEKVELTECDRQTTWNFTMESAEPLGDGTKVRKLTALAPGNCQYYGFEAKWTLQNGQLFISTSRIGGMGGSSLAGLMEIKELSSGKMVLVMMKKELTFVRKSSQ